MEKEKLLHYVAPCSLLCYTCLALKDGAFSECAPRLNMYCEGVCEFLAESYGSHMPEQEREKHFSFFNEFHGALAQLSGGTCHGCRNDDPMKNGCLDGCVVPACVKGRGVDFCAQCDEFPCQKAKDFFDAHSDKLSRRWEMGNMRIQAVGIDAYFEENKDSSHYIDYKKKTE